MRIAEPLGHGATLARLWTAAGDGHLPHAILFEGPEGIGKHMAMGWFAAGLLCAAGPGPSCGTCPPCKRVRSGGDQGNHPDLFTIDPVAEGEEQIRVARVAQRSGGDGGAGAAGRAGSGPDCVEAFLDLRSVEGGWRAVLIRDAERMNEAAQNALLKTLEEPRPGTVLLLGSHRPERLLPTLRSRCIRVRLRAPAPAACEAVLAEAGLEAREARALARWCGGAPGRALAWQRRGATAFRDRLLAVLAGEGAPLALATELWELEGDFPGERPTVRARARARFVLELALALARDALRLAHGLPEDDLPHGPDLRALGLLFRPLRTRRALEALLTAWGDVERNLQPEAVVERALLALERIGPRAVPAGGAR